MASSAKECIGCGPLERRSSKLKGRVGSRTAPWETTAFKGKEWDCTPSSRMNIICQLKKLDVSNVTDSWNPKMSDFDRKSLCQTQSKAPGISNETRHVSSWLSSETSCGDETGRYKQ